MVCSKHVPKIYLLYMFLFLQITLAINSNENFEVLNSPHRFTQAINSFVKEEPRQVSSKCWSFLKEFAVGMETQQAWALKMFDAAGKFPSGIMEGNLVVFGSFDECIKIKATLNSSKDIEGMYCLAEMSIARKERNAVLAPNNSANRSGGVLEKLRFTMAVCGSNLCSISETQRLYKYLQINMKIRPETCQSKSSQPELNGGAIATISFLGVVLGIVVAMTTYDVVLFYTKKEAVHPLLLSFSVLSNGRTLMKVSKNPSRIGCLDGIRVISMMWIVLGHRYQVQLSHPSSNSFFFVEWKNNKANMYLINANLSVDTFLVMSGMVISYIYMGQKKRMFNVLLYYVHRYLRLTPAFAVVILCYATILTHIGSGPYWPITVGNMAHECREKWWKALLYIQNINNIGMCVDQTWYLCVDFQLFLISPLVLFPMKRYPKATYAALGVLTFLSTLAGFLTAWFFDFNSNMIGNIGGTDTLLNFMKYYYFVPWTRAPPWFIGLLLGCAVYHCKQKRLPLGKVCITVIWGVSSAVACACVFGGHDLMISDHSKAVLTLYTALIRPAWALSVSWIILACAAGYGGPIEWFLSLPLFQVTSKLTYSLCLVHYAAIYTQQAEARIPPFLSDRNEMFMFWGDLATSLFVATLLCLMFESPMVMIEKHLLRGGRPKQPAIEDRNAEEAK